jgi:hypothetical protein
MRQATGRHESGSGSARPEHAVDRAIALDDDIRCVGCRAATGVVIGHVEREALSGAEHDGSVRAQSRCHVWFLDASPRVCALKGRQTSREVVPISHGMRIPRA